MFFRFCPMAILSDSVRFCQILSDSVRSCPILSDSGSTLPSMLPRGPFRPKEWQDILGQNRTESASGFNLYKLEIMYCLRNRLRNEHAYAMSKSTYLCGPLDCGAVLQNRMAPLWKPYFFSSRARIQVFVAPMCSVYVFMHILP